MKPSKPRLSNLPSKPKEKNFGCEFCGKTFLYNCHLKKHVADFHTHVDMKYITCEVCNKRFVKKHFKEHMARHAKPKFNCEHCDEKFDFKSKQLEHIKTEHMGLTYSCTICGKRYREKSYLKAHMMSHENIESVTCTVCNKIFACPSNLKIHFRIAHLGEKRKYYKADKERKHPRRICDICGKVLQSTEGFNCHMNQHRGIKKYVCKGCGKAFVSSMRLREHERVHTREKPYVCNVCTKGFAQRNGLTIHLRYHTGERPFKCEICKKGFVTGNLVKKHSRKEHGDPIGIKFVPPATNVIAPPVGFNF